MNTKITFDRIDRFTTQSSNLSKSISWFSNGCAYLFDYFTRKHEPQIRQIRNAEGDVSYHVYDSYTGRSTHFDTGHAVRVWLDQLPYS